MTDMQLPITRPLPIDAEVQPRQVRCFVCYACYSMTVYGGVRTLRTLDTSDPRQFGTSAEVSVGHFGPFIKC